MQKEDAMSSKFWAVKFFGMFFRLFTALLFVVPDLFYSFYTVPAYNLYICTEKNFIL